MQRGFTLIETLIVIALVVIMVGVLTDVYLNYGKAYGQVFAQSTEVGDAARFANAVSDAVRAADAVLPSYTFSGTTYTSTTTSLVLELPSIDSSGTVITNEHDYFAFFASGTKAYEIAAPAAGSARQSGTTLFSSALSSLTFTYDNATPANATSVDINLELSSSTESNDASTHIHETTYLLNK